MSLFFKKGIFWMGVIIKYDTVSGITPSIRSCIRSGGNFSYGLK